ncbi:MAG: hypothetical protein QXU32_00670 [Nitrososphaerales archaeon]
MPFSLARIDNELAQSVFIEFVESPSPVSGFPIGPGILPLQFPPLIIRDSKRANWDEQPLPTYEPQTMWKGAEARNITIKIVYIVSGGMFNTSAISILTKNVKAYFYRTMTGESTIPIVKIRFYNHVGRQIPADFRLLNVNIDHGETLIKDNFGVFPLRTDITLDAALTTRVENKQHLRKLRDKPPTDWY